MPPPPPLLLVDRYVRFEDELLAVVEESGQPSLDLVIESVLGRLPDSSSPEERDAAIDAEILRYMEEVNEPAFKILCERKASRPSTVVREVPIACTTAEEFAYYSELLDGIEPCLSPLDGAPSVTSLTLRISWRPKHPVRSYPLSAYIAGSDDTYLVLYFGSHRPSSPDHGFYLVYDTLANSVSIIPPLSSSGSHCGLGDEVAILGIRKIPHPCFYVLAELLFRVKSHSYLPSNMGTLFMWWSPGSSPLDTCRWIQRDVVLPIPADEGSTSTTPTYSFHADVIIPVLGRSIFWVDLLKGILVCDHIDLLVDDSDAPIYAPAPHDIVFYFIPLPDGCAIQPDLCKGRGQPDEYRSMCSITSKTFKFVSMEAYSEGCLMDNFLFRTWVLVLHGDGTWTWDKLFESRIDIWNDPIYKNDLKLQPLTPQFPIISCGLGGKTDRDIIYLLLTDFKLEHGWTVATGSYVFSLDIRHGNIASAIRLPCDEDGMVMPMKIFASHFNFFLMDNFFLMEENILARRNVELTHYSMGKQIVDHKGRLHGKFGKWTLCEEENPLSTYTLRAHRGKSGKWTLCEEDDLSMPCKLEAHFATLKFCQDGLGGRRIVSTLGASSSSSKNEPCGSVGLHAIIDEPFS